ncbi:MAG: type II secretion system protein GspG [Planctomycetaceae bacterium]|jgi:hypothetical protein|nr:type II secretion system protein GspG [Planctomycetaceae bacterium]
MKHTKQSISEKTLPIEVDKKLIRFQIIAFFFFLLVIVSAHIGFCLAWTYHPKSWIRSPQEKTVRNIQYLAQQLEKYRNENKVFPDQLETLFTERENIEFIRKYNMSDGWLQFLIYSTDGNSWQLLSYGSDGKPGGVGIEIDILCNDKMYTAGTIRNACQNLYPTMQQILDGGWIGKTVSGFFLLVLALSILVISSLLFLLFLT